MTKRRHFSPEQKATILRRHLAGKEPVSQLAEELAIQPSQIHLWVKQLLDQAERAFQSNGRGRTDPNPEQRRLAALEAAVARKDALVAENSSSSTPDNWLPIPFGRMNLAHVPFGIGTKAINLRGRMPRSLWQDALIDSLTPTGQNSNSR
jgi:transposase-like protein